MLTRWNDWGKRSGMMERPQQDEWFGGLDRPLGIMDEFRRRMMNLFDEMEMGRGPIAGLTGIGMAMPRFNIFDTESALMIQVDLPGVNDSDLDISVHEQMLTIKGERKAKVPDGYTVQRQERGDMRFSRSMTLPVKVDAKKTSARMDNGVLTIELEKAPESKPRQIKVQSK